MVEPVGPVPANEAEILKEESEGLKTLQGFADKWVTIVTTVAGVSAVLGFGFKAEDIASLSTEKFGVVPIDARQAVVGLGLLALLAIAAAVFFAGRAATGGEPRVIALTIPARRRNIDRIAQAAIGDMRAARWLTAIGIGLAAGAIAVALLGDRQGPGDKRWILNEVSATPGAGRVYCGQIGVDPADGHLLFSAASTGDVAAKIVTDYKALTETTECP